MVWDLEKGERVAFGYGIWKWEGVVRQIGLETGRNPSWKIHIAEVESDTGRMFNFKWYIWEVPETRWEPREFKYGEYSVTTDEGDRAVPTRLSKVG